MCSDIMTAAVVHVPFHIYHYTTSLLVLLSSVFLISFFLFLTSLFFVILTLLTTYIRKKVYSSCFTSLQAYPKENHKNSLQLAYKFSMKVTWY